MIEVRGLTKRYGDEAAVDDISFAVRPGEVLGFLGPNGAGKTTTMKVITCYLPPSEGTVYVDGRDVREDTLEIRRLIGYLPEHTPLYHDMITLDYLRFVSDVRGVAPSDRKRRIASTVEACGLQGVLGKKIDALSKGYRQRVGLAQALVHDPPILILDEPTTGLDPNQIVEIRDLITSIGKEKTVILSTHILPEVQASCDRVLIIHKGRLVADGTPEDLQDSFAGGQRVHFGVRTPASASASTSKAANGALGDRAVTTALESWGRARIVDTRLEGSETLYTLASDEAEDLRPALFQLAVDRGWTLTELHRQQVNLEDVFRQLTSASPEQQMPSIHE